MGYWIFIGVPPLLLGIGVVHSSRTRRRRYIAVYLAALAAWLAHVAWKLDAAFRERGPIPASVGIPEPDAISFEGPRPILIDERPVLRLEAPGDMSWKLHGNERAVRFDFGFVPEAYENGTTNGATVVLRLLRDGTPREIFRRELRPHSTSADRGNQRIRVVLPPIARGERLLLAIEAGEHGDNAWDWLYLTQLDWERSRAFLPEQFPLHARLPDSAEAPLASHFQKDGKTSFLQLHAPATLTYRLRKGETRLQFTFGFLPAAYRDPNATDGARFVAILENADHEETILFARLLTPRERATDRGPQHADLLLPESAPGTILRLKIEPGPAGNHSWDWTYLSRVHLD